MLAFKTFLASIVGMALAAGIVYGLFQLTILYPDYWLTVVFVSWLILVLIAYRGSKQFKLTDGDDGMVIYQNYYDLFKCLSVIGVPVVLYYIGAHFGQIEAAHVASAIFAAGMFLHICYESAKINRFLDLPVVYLVKFSTSFLWFIAIFQTLNPSGRNAAARRKNRAVAALVLFFLTPIINMFVLDDNGKDLIKNKFRGRRFQGARQIRNAMN